MIHVTTVLLLLYACRCSEARRIIIIVISLRNVVYICLYYTDTYICYSMFLNDPHCFSLQPQRSLSNKGRLFIDWVGNVMLSVVHFWEVCVCFVWENVCFMQWCYVKVHEYHHCSHGCIAQCRVFNFKQNNRRSAHLRRRPDTAVRAISL